MSYIQIRSTNSATPVKVTTAFGASLVHALKACLASLDVTASKHITFCNSEYLDLNVQYNNEGRKIQAGYLSFTKWHSERYCQFSGRPHNYGDTIFVCDHIVSYIFYYMLSIISNKHSNMFNTEIARHIAQSSACAKLSLMPRAITLLSTGVDTAMIVSWVLFRPPPNDTFEARVLLHTSKCEERSALRSKLIYNPEEGKSIFLYL